MKNSSVVGQNANDVCRKCGVALTLFFVLGTEMDHDKVLAEVCRLGYGAAACRRYFHFCTVVINFTRRELVLRKVVRDFSPILSRDARHLDSVTCQHAPPTHGQCARNFNTNSRNHNTKVRLACFRRVLVSEEFDHNYTSRAVHRG